MYSTFYEKAAAVIQSLIINHPFVDGNKRTGILLGEALLLNDNVEINAMENDSYDFVIKVSTGDLSFEDIVLWLQQNTKPILL